MSRGSPEIPATPMAPLMVQLLYDTPPQVSIEALTAKVEAYCGRTDPKHRPAPGATSAHYFMLDAIAHFKGGDLPSQLCLMPSTGLDRGKIDTALSQTWEWDGAREITASCKHALVAVDLMAANVERATRSRQFRGFIRALQEIAPCRAMHWMNSGVIIDPQRFLEQQRQPEAAAYLHGSVNVRFYNIEGTDGDMLMDTQGLGVLGLPDLQCHFRDLPPPHIAAQLYNVAAYLFERGDIIKDGQTVPGPPNNAPWHCQHEMSLAPPERIVLDLNPGSPYAAGNRSPAT